MLNLNFSPFPHLSTARFSLRPLELEDELEIFALRSYPEVNRYLDRKPAASLDDAREFIAKIKKGIGENVSIMWAISLKEQPSLLGSICFWNIDRNEDKADIGYELLPAWQGKGIIREVMPVVIEYAFSTMGLRIIEAELDPGNLRSVKILEKFNFIPEPPSSSQSVIYSLHATHINNRQ